MNFDISHSTAPFFTHGSLVHQIVAHVEYTDYDHTQTTGSLWTFSVIHVIMDLRLVQLPSLNCFWDNSQVEITQRFHNFMIQSQQFQASLKECFILTHVNINIQVKEKHVWAIRWSLTTARRRSQSFKCRHPNPQQSCGAGVKGISVIL